MNQTTTNSSKIFNHRSQWWVSKFSPKYQNNPNPRPEPDHLQQCCTDRVWLTQEALTLVLTFTTGTEMPDAILMKPFHKYTNEPQSQLGPFACSAGADMEGVSVCRAGGRGRFTYRLLCDNSANILLWTQYLAVDTNRLGSGLRQQVFTELTSWSKTNSVCGLRMWCHSERAEKLGQLKCWRHDQSKNTFS